VSAILGQIPEVTNVFVEGGTSSDTKANVIVNYGQKNTRDRSSFVIEDDMKALLQDLPDVKINVLKDNGQRDVQLNVLGDTEAAASAAAIELSNQMNDLPDIVNAATTASLVRPEIQITPRPQLAAEMGVTSAALASTIRIATLGDTDSNVAKFNAGDRQIPILVRVKKDVRDDLSRLEGLRVPSSTGSPVPISVVADVALSSGPSKIERYDRQYRTSVEADLAPDGLLGPATQAVMALPIAQAMPEGTSIQSAGDAEVMGEVFTQFGLAMGAGILLVYVVLVLLFHSFVTPVTILLSLPLAIGGAIFALYLNGSAIGLSVVIGFLMLMGIVTKNAIMLVEFAIEAMKDGATRSEAMLQAGHKRARPIIMTTVAMTAGMVPSAMAVGAGGEFRAPMAVAVIGGLLLSTMLSLLFVPSLFSVMDGLKERIRWAMIAVLGANRPRDATSDR
jgi:multidrug efflux pump subunit AcrB